MSALSPVNDYQLRLPANQAIILARIAALPVSSDETPALLIGKFFNDVLPVVKGGAYCLNVGREKPGPHQWCASTQEIGAEALLACYVDGKQVWFSTAVFNPDGEKDSSDCLRRTNKNVLALKTHRIDLDVGDGSGKYSSQRQALEALDKFTSMFGIPPTWIVGSGNGVHAYWCFKDQVPVGTWQPQATRFKTVLKDSGVLADESVTADPSRLLRPIGTLNLKDPKEPKWVWPICARGPLTSFAEFEAALTKLLGVKAPAIGGMAEMLTPLANMGKRSWSLSEATAMLACLAPDIPEPEWWLALSQVAEWSNGQADAYELCKSWSRGDLHGQSAEKWDETAFEKKWQRAADSVGREGNAGWSSLRATAEANGYVDPEKIHSLATKGEASFANSEPGDILAARVYANATRDKLIFVNQAGRWLQWEGARWAWCEQGEEMAYAKKTADMVLQSAIDLVKEDKDKHQKRLSAALKLQNLPRLEAMIELAKSEPGMCIGHMTELDSNPWLLGVRNGIVNLRDGGLLAPDPKMLMTRQVAAAYKHDAESPSWLAFLDSIFEGDTATISFIQRALGYTLTGVTTEEVLFICFGSGANGKSVFGNVIAAILADYAQAAPPSLLTVRRDGDAGPRNDIARLCGARLVSINETQNGDRLDEQIVKMLAGRERLSARFLHKEYFDFLPTAKPWLRTNHRPIVTGDDDGVWRRLHLIPFRKKFAEHERDPWLEQKLLEERDGILAWMVRGCLEWQRIGLAPSEAVRRESSTYRKESDLLGEFLEEKTATDHTTKVDQTNLFCTWRAWNEVNGTRCGSKSSFTRKLSERGFEAVRSNGARFYAGLRLL